MNVIINEAEGTSATVEQRDGPQGPELHVQIEQLVGGMISTGRFDKAMRGRYNARAIGGR
jgi:hypothetical protein